MLEHVADEVHTRLRASHALRERARYAQLAQEDKPLSDPHNPHNRGTAPLLAGRDPHKHPHAWDHAARQPG